MIERSNREHHPLPGRLYRHGTQFDFMVSFRKYEPSDAQLKGFQKVLTTEVEASQALEKMIYESRKKARPHHALFHRRLDLSDIGEWKRGTANE